MNYSAYSTGSSLHVYMLIRRMPFWGLATVQKCSIFISYFGKLPLMSKKESMERAAKATMTQLVELRLVARVANAMDRK